MTNQELAINTWLDVIGDVQPAEKQKARSLLARVQGKGRTPEMPEAEMEPTLESDEERVETVEPAAAPAMPDDLHDLLSLFQ